MDNISHLDDENYDVDYRPSSSSLDQNDQSTTETAACSTMGADSFSYCRTNSEISNFSVPTCESHSYCGEPSPSYWPGSRSTSYNQATIKRLSMKQHQHCLDDKLSDQDSIDAELELMKDRFARLLLGEDMSGGGKGVCTAVTISNAITNLYATIFGQNLKLEPLSPDKKAMWKREMDCLLSVCDYIVEFIPESQNLRDGTAFEVMTNKLRSDIYINLPALKKLDAMLIGILDSFEDAEFWYVEPGSMSEHSSRSVSFRKVIPRPAQRVQEKWWLPVPRVSRSGLSEDSRKHIRQKRDCASQIHKAAMAINSSILSDMEIPEKYIASLPKCGKASVGESIYRHFCMGDKFSPEYLLNCLKIPSEREALKLANRIEASMYTWRRKACMHHSKSSWDMVKEFMSDTDKVDKNTLLAERAESLLICLKQRYPVLTQTSLDTSKIQYNRDVGKAVLESYSRVLEGLAFNVVAWIDDVLYADKSMRLAE